MRPGRETDRALDSRCRKFDSRLVCRQVTTVRKSFTHNYVLLLPSSKTERMPSATRKVTAGLAKSTVISCKVCTTWLMSLADCLPRSRKSAPAVTIPRNIDWEFVAYRFQFRKNSRISPKKIIKIRKKILCASLLNTKAITASFPACLIHARAGQSINEPNFELWLCEFRVCILCFNFGKDILWAN